MTSEFFSESMPEGSEQGHQDVYQELKVQNQWKEQSKGR